VEADGRAISRAFHHGELLFPLHHHPRNLAPVRRGYRETGLHRRYLGKTRPWFVRGNVYNGSPTRRPREGSPFSFLLTEVGMQQIQEALTFDDVLLKPAASAVLPNQTDTRTRLTRTIDLR